VYQNDARGFKPAICYSVPLSLGEEVRVRADGGPVLIRLFMHDTLISG